MMYKTDSFEIRHKLELRLGAPYIAKIRKLWEESVRQAFEAMPNIEWEAKSDESDEDILIDWIFSNYNSLSTTYNQFAVTDCDAL